MKTPLGTEVGLGPGHIVLDGVPAVRKRGTSAPFFSVHVYCGHSRPSQLLLSSCCICIMCITQSLYIACMCRIVTWRGRPGGI